jgi:hypothetical protein
LLHRLQHEDHILIKYSKGEKVKGKTKKQMVKRVMPIGELAAEIAHQHNLDKMMIRSLIVEKIMLEAKRRERKTILGLSAMQSKAQKKQTFNPSQSSIFTSSQPSIELRLIIIPAGHFILNPDATPNNGDCFFETVIMLGANTDKNVKDLRTAANQGGARNGILNMGEWANISDITSLANALGVRFRIVALDLDYKPIQISTAGSSGHIYNIAQIFGGHFVPLNHA